MHQSINQSDIIQQNTIHESDKFNKMRENHKLELQRKIITLRNATQVGVKIRLETIRRQPYTALRNLALGLLEIG